MNILEKLKSAGKKPDEIRTTKKLPAVDKSGKRPSKTLYMLKKWKWVWIILLVLLVIAGFMGYRQYSRYEARQAMQKAMSTIETTRVTKQNLIDSISVTGTIASADAWDVSASAKDVEVLQVNYEVGDYVNEGDIIVVLDTADLELSLTQAQNKQALSEYNESKSIEQASENYAEAVEDGTDSYNKAVKSEAEAKERLQEAEDDLAEAASRLKRREEKLSEANEALAAVSRPQEPEKPDPDNYGNGEDDEEYKAALQEYENALNEYKADLEEYNELEKAASAASASYTEAHQAYNTAADAEEKAVDTYENAAEALADAEKNNNRNIASAADSLEKSQMEHTYSNDSSQQTIENYQEQIESCTVTAPISGVITAMNVDVGDTYMGEGSTLFSVADNEHFIVSASVDEYDISNISKDMAAAVIVEAIGDGELPATVSFVSPTVTNSNMGSSSYAIEIALDEANTDLRIGMTAKASIILEAVYDVLTVPYDCVETDENGNSFLYMDQDGEKKKVGVTLGMEGDYYVEVSGDGLDENSTVYYSTPMTNTESAGDSLDDDNGALDGLFSPGGGDNPGGGGNPGGRGNSGGGGNPGGGGGAPGGF